MKEIKIESINDKLMKKLDDYIKSNKKLNVDSLMKVNRSVGIVFSIIDIKIRLYVFYYLALKLWKELVHLWRNQSLINRN